MNIAAVVIRRAAQCVALGLLLTAATFLLCSFIPGDFFSIHQLDPGIRADAIDQLRRRYGLDLPFYKQYARWLLNVLQLDLGYSLFYRTQVSSIVAGALINTLWIGIPALVLGISGGLCIGSLHGACRSSLFRRVLDLAFTSALSLPPLILGLVALLFASATHWFPLGGVASPVLQDAGTAAGLLDRWHHLMLPVACLALPMLTWIERVQSAAVRHSAEALVVRSALARGLGQSRIFFQYLLRPSLNPVLSTFGPLLGSVLSGSLVLELIFSWPGLGQVTYDALFNRDPQLLVGCVLAGGILLMVGNLAADILLAALDPQTRTLSSRPRWHSAASN